MTVTVRKLAPDDDRTQRRGFVALALTAGELGDRPQPQPMFLELG